jgi:hypothetical protein
MATVIDLRAVDIIRSEVERFTDVARQRSESDPVQRRRSRRRYQRSWPLAVMLDGADVSAALHNASDEGIAFLSHNPVMPDTVVFIKLFCYDESAAYVPAVVRHSTSTEHGYLIGCEFALSDEALCREAIMKSPQTAGAY